MKYYAAFLTMKDKEKSRKYRPEHLDYLKELRDQKRILLYGRLVDGAGGLIIYQGDSLEEVTEWVKEDPYVKLGARGYEVHEWEMQTDYTIN
ncbi:YciI family protein [Pseudogracilibacillus sp. SO30301A]|uniref:YciI family protein n=1 Tax=Pseudogracilibacillus sp. SO30301A TaxID=3098291 RepID=UPI00300E2E15